MKRHTDLSHYQRADMYQGWDDDLAPKPFVGPYRPLEWIGIFFVGGLLGASFALMVMS